MLTLLQDLDTFWKTETSGLFPDTDIDGSFLKAYMQSSITRQPNGTLSLKFPWKEDHPSLRYNFSVCAKRTRSLAQRLAKTPELLHTYGRIFADQEGKGFIEKVNDFRTHEAHYIPHRPVKKDSDTTPIRIVYDCSCKQSSLASKSKRLPLCWPTLSEPPLCHTVALPPTCLCFLCWHRESISACGTW